MIFFELAKDTSKNEPESIAGSLKFRATTPFESWSGSFGLFAAPTQQLPAAWHPSSAICRKRRVLGDRHVSIPSFRIL
jgi:hypothetical protein